MKSLAVEDDIVSGSLLKKILSSYGTVDNVSSGQKALDKFEESLDSGVKYDFICLDIMMPEMTGHEVLQKIREIEETRGITEGVKIIMTTALDDFESIKRAYRDQCDDYLVKPILRSNIEEALKKLGLI